VWRDVDGALDESTSRLEVSEIGSAVVVLLMIVGFSEVVCCFVVCFVIVGGCEVVVGVDSDVVVPLSLSAFLHNCCGPTPARKATMRFEPVTP
jgi:hypothetical protein